jgi:hypothetical protein
VVFVAGYWGAHTVLYGRDGATAATPAAAPLSTHTHDPDNPHPTAQ